MDMTFANFYFLGHLFFGCYWVQVKNKWELQFSLPTLAVGTTNLEKFFICPPTKNRLPRLNPNQNTCIATQPRSKTALSVCDVPSVGEGEEEGCGDF